MMMQRLLFQSFFVSKSEIKYSQEGFLSKNPPGCHEM